MARSRADRAIDAIRKRVGAHAVGIAGRAFGSYEFPLAKNSFRAARVKCGPREKMSADFASKHP